jgi:uncharacterized protein (DUF4415 family)
MLVKLDTRRDYQEARWAALGQLKDAEFSWPTRSEARMSASSPFAGPTKTKGRFMPRQSKTDWDRLKAMTEEEIEANALADLDAQPTDETFWTEAKVSKPVKKVSLSVQLDSDVAEWFKALGKDYQGRINAVLKAYKNARS